jgi:hypothetical protein
MTQLVKPWYSSTKHAVDIVKYFCVQPDVVLCRKERESVPRISTQDVKPNVVLATLWIL